MHYILLVNPQAQSALIKCIPRTISAFSQRLCPDLPVGAACLFCPQPFTCKQASPGMHGAHACKSAVGTCKPSSWATAATAAVLPEPTGPEIQAAPPPFTPSSSSESTMSWAPWVHARRVKALTAAGRRRGSCAASPFAVRSLCACGCLPRDQASSYHARGAR